MPFMVLDPDLLQILRCPESREPLVYFPRGESDDDESKAFLLCPASRLRYRIDEGIPVMLVDEAERLEQAAADALMSRASELGLAQ
jgi:hypothetical protein